MYSKVICVCTTHCTMKYQYVNYYLDQNILPKYKMKGSTRNLSEPPATAGNPRVNASSLLSKFPK